MTDKPDRVLGNVLIDAVMYKGYARDKKRLCGNEVKKMSAEEYQEIIRGITAGLSGDFKEDGNYLLGKMKEYKDHEYETEIVRACGRLFQEIAPDDFKKDLVEAMNKDVHNYFLGLQSVAEKPGSTSIRKTGRKHWNLLKASWTL